MSRRPFSCFWYEVPTFSRIVAPVRTILILDPTHPSQLFFFNLQSSLPLAGAQGAFADAASLARAATTPVTAAALHAGVDHAVVAAALTRWLDAAMAANRLALPSSSAANTAGASHSLALLLHLLAAAAVTKAGCGNVETQAALVATTLALLRYADGRVAVQRRVASLLVHMMQVRVCVCVMSRRRVCTGHLIVRVWVWMGEWC